MPCLILSPFSRGGLVCSPYYTDSSGNLAIDPAATFDQTSINRFIAKVFGAQGKSVELPQPLVVAPGVTGDFATVFAGVTDTTVPKLPQTSLADPQVAAQAVVNALAGTVVYAPTPYPPPSSNGMFPPATDGGQLTPTYRRPGA